MRIKPILFVLAFVLAAGLPACSCESGPYITSPEADVTATDTSPPSEDVE